MGQISDKDVQCFLYLVVSTLNSEKEINLPFLEKLKTEAVAQKCSGRKGVFRNLAKFIGKSVWPESLFY